MTNLDCIVSNCVYNDDKCCCREDITVKGRSAESNKETCCGSFVEQKDGAVKQAAGKPSKETDVFCDACKCEFNQDHKCGAEHIGIAGKSACSCVETECSSFCCCN